MGEKITFKLYSMQKKIKKCTQFTETMQFSENGSALECDLFSFKQYFFFWFSSEKVHPRTLN